MGPQRNWLTDQLEGPAFARVWGFESRPLRRPIGDSLARGRPLLPDPASPEELQRRMLRDSRMIPVDREEFVAADQGARGDEAVDP